MNENIVGMSFSHGVALLRISGYTREDSGLKVQACISKLKKEDPKTLVQAPTYEGFDANLKLHTCLLRVIMGTNTKEILRLWGLLILWESKA